ncbi:phosphotransferase family protein [Mycobacterium sp. OTB74]|uniref:phosphotransferase family protein n=1 Tax=Mycobacterium sp. OTB74 TaxID=1853452 RepID=UPI0024771669|nr:phosphotransferase family protein [Mycobacterium sp. OTB74]MDH6242711.1 aminoglycoside phosphotransferase (APT) family kinase protein [Mycobacterium sp. OTB74]
MSYGIDIERLSRWLDSQKITGDGELANLTQLSGGSQNVLYLIERGGNRMVMRMPGYRADQRRLNELLREIRLVRALACTDVPHAELIAADESGELLGKPFYVMAEIDGWSPMDGGWAAPFDTDLDARSGLAFQLIEGAAKLARVDWRAQGLEGFGHPEGFHDRQVDRWLSFLKEFQVRELPGLEVATEWLRANRPAHFTPGIMHGDYQFANVMYAHGAPARLAALVDWEMTTIGDPLLDLAWALLGYDGDEPKSDFYLPMEGMPRRSELLEHYERISGLPTDNLDYYLVLANFKIGIVLERTYARNVSSADGNPEVAEAFGSMVLQSIATAADMARSLAGTAR